MKHFDMHLWSVRRVARDARLMVRAVVCALTMLTAVVVPTRAADEEEEEPQYSAGLIGEYSSAGAAPIRRVDEDVQFVWHDAKPDARLPSGPFQVRWSGKLFTMTPGEYRFHLYVGGGRGELTFGGKKLLAFDSAQPGWQVTEPVKLSYAHTPLELTFATSAPSSTVKLHWSGPQFAVEPIPERHLFHDPKQSPPRSFDEGRALVRALRCAACHTIPDRQPAISAPALTHLDGNMNFDWMVEHLSSSLSLISSEAPPQASDRARRMPHFSVSREDAAAIAAYLFDASAKSAEVKVPKAKEPPPEPAADDPDKKKKPKPRKDPSVAAGARLLQSTGCMACHTSGGLGTESLFGGGDLTMIAEKRPPEFFVRWFQEPAKVNSSHRMPMFKLTSLDQADAAVYLMTHRNTATSDRPNHPEFEDIPPAGIQRGRELVEALHCAACHKLPGDPEPKSFAATRPIAELGKPGCFGEPDAKRPGYRLDDARRAAIVEYLTKVVPATDQHALPIDGRHVLQERNCTACHARGLGGGLADVAPKITAVHADLLPLQAAMLPPSLNGVGDKLPDESLEAAITLKRDPLRPWLLVRMPKFELSADEMTAVKRYFIEHDRIPDLPPVVESVVGDETAQRLAARRLVTADGFGCTSCHKIGNSEPQGITNLAAHGTDLTMIGQRIRKPWFDRWVRNPPRIIPRMEMPAIQLPIKGVLHDDVNAQLSAVWKVINEPGFNPPLPNPVRIVRARNVPGTAERPNVLTDVFIADGKTFVSPIVIGLPNRHNVLFDLETNRLSAWWTGDTALERTKGKSWYWEPGGAMVVNPAQFGEGREFTYLVRNADNLPPNAQTGQNLAVLDAIETTANGVAFTSRYGFFRIRQTFEPLPVDPKSPQLSGVRRTIDVDGASVLVAFTPNGQGNEELPGSPRVIDRLHLDHNRSMTTMFTSMPTLVNGKQVDRLVIDYVVDLPIDTFPVDLPSLPSPPSVKLDVVPGFDAVQLPLSPAEMPTGLAWKRDGTLVVASLKGRVFTARDTDGDGLEDKLDGVSRDLATPYGVAVAEENGREVIDVIDKTALVRLYDDDGDGFCERSAVVADGWGHTDDYHDWAVGLPKIPGGGYYVALPCQQDDRDPAKATWRGQALRLIPTEPTINQPRRFRVEPFAGGLRFPMGLAVNQAGALFASDNQGNYNPFNEVNHLQDGRRYGFINKLEQKPEFKPRTESPALELPHPWTRSVNGLCFLDTPKTVREQRRRDGLPENLFGPFEGHLIGCEYNYRSLMRMTLHEVDGVYQGAAFLFSEQPKPGAATFEGPTVCEIAPDGDLYVGNMQDSGWGGGRNTGSIVRIKPGAALTAGMADIRAEYDGFTIEFTQPVSREAAAKTTCYKIELFRRISTPQYGGDDVDRAAVKVRKAVPAGDGRSVRLLVEPMRAGFVYEFHVDGLVDAATPFFPAEAFYTMKRLPNDRRAAADGK